MRKFSYSPLWLARSLVELTCNPERPSSRGRDRPGLLLKTPCRVPLRELMSGMLTPILRYTIILRNFVVPFIFPHEQSYDLNSC